MRAKKSADEKLKVKRETHNKWKLRNKEAVQEYQKRYYELNKGRIKAGIKAKAEEAAFVMPTATGPTFKVPVYHFGA